MPPFIRTLIVIMVGYPGAFLWFLGGFGGMASLGFLLMGSLEPKYWLMFLGFLTAALIGHLMKALVGYTLGDTEQRMAGNQIGQRMAWDLAIDLQGIGIVGAGIALAPTLARADWQRSVLAAVLCIALAYLLILTNRGRAAFLDRWVQEHIHDPLPPS
ncbi:hypothetical protein [Haloferula sp. BvORR071]|uniref:hypothetical protein n=1 Tax=Haloferula sp. BvORR071 TaxID=1396141 RepID=UPI000555AC21|nr:hypothetical protein [Haloferula sp. BvORR071]